MGIAETTYGNNVKPKKCGHHWHEVELTRKVRRCSRTNMIEADGPLGSTPKVKGMVEIECCHCGDRKLMGIVFKPQSWIANYYP